MLEQILKKLVLNYACPIAAPDNFQDFQNYDTNIWGDWIGYHAVPLGVFTTKPNPLLRDSRHI